MKNENITKMLKNIYFSNKSLQEKYECKLPQNKFPLRFIEQGYQISMPKIENIYKGGKKEKNSVFFKVTFFFVFVK